MKSCGRILQTATVPVVFAYHTNAFVSSSPFRAESSTFPSRLTSYERCRSHRKRQTLFSDPQEESFAENAALPRPSESLEEELLEDTSTASVATMISRENKRILIEELGYRRVDVDRLKFELAPAIVERRLYCSKQGMPESWCRPPQEVAQESAMMKRLEQESQYPLKVPLIGVSLILFGKGFSDAIITLIKVNMDFPGASLTDDFMGIPILLIDAVCAVLGASLAWWTWENMK